MTTGEDANLPTSPATNELQWSLSAESSAVARMASTTLFAMTHRGRQDMPVALSAQRLIDRETGKVTWQTTGSRTQNRRQAETGRRCPLSDCPERCDSLSPSLLQLTLAYSAYQVNRSAEGLDSQSAQVSVPILHLLFQLKERVHR